MNETTRRFARLVDLSAVQATSTEADVRACAELAARYNIISVHVLPCWTRFLSTLLPQQGTGEVMIGGPVGFPGGGHTTDTKVPGSAAADCRRRSGSGYGREYRQSALRRL